MSSGLPAIVIRNLTHKWEKLIRSSDEETLDRAKIMDMICQGVPDVVRKDVWTLLIRKNSAAGA